MDGHNSKKKDLNSKHSKINSSHLYKEKEENNTREKEINDEKKEENTNPDIKLQLIYSINKHKDWVESVKIFPSGNIISVSDDKSINIFNGNNYNILQSIKNAHMDRIIYLSIKDENNFATLL